MTYAEAIAYLHGLQMFGARLGLENTQRLAALAGNPQNQLRFIHVAGTNGKGSTCAMLESIYRTTGLRVGLYTSPHLVAFGERIQVNRQHISEADLVQFVEQMRVWLKDCLPDTHPTFFEAVTVMALQYFAEQKCDLVIWETGLGGRLDATNIVTPLASVITNISFDHENWLGHTLAQIATEKAGIIKSGIPVLTSTDAPEALAVIKQTAQAINSPLTVVDRSAAERLPYSTSLLGEHQRLNAALAVATTRALQSQLPVTDEQIRRGLETVSWPGRLQVLRRGSQTLLLDGAHNPAGVAALIAAVRQHFPNSKPTLLTGMLRDKDWQAMSCSLAPLAHRIFAVPVASERTVSAEELRATCHVANPVAECLAFTSLAEALARASDDAFVIITGSLYFIGEAMELLRMLPSKDTDERGLNEWKASK